MNQLNAASTSAVRLEVVGTNRLALPDFDLSLILERVQFEHPEWTKGRLEAAEIEYRRYLTLCKLEPETALIPTLDADEIWHAHILHTKQYRQDCNDYFGYFLDHAPFNRRNEKFPVGYTAKLYFEVFGIEYNTGNTAECTNCNCTEGISTRVKRIQ